MQFETTRSDHYLVLGSEAHAATSVWGRADYLCLALGVILVLASSVILGRGRIFWEDEMLGWMILTDPSWHHALEAWMSGADGGGASFYLTARPWLHLFGPSETSFRLYAATCFAISFVLNWCTMRRFYGVWITAFALFGTYFLSPPIVLHFVEGRFYGLLMLSVSFAIWASTSLQDAPEPRRRGSLTLFAAHSLLTTSHLLGVVYSAVILIGMIVLDLSRKKWRPDLYWSVLASWLLLIPEISAIRASALIGKPWFWTTPPTLFRFLGAYSAFSSAISAVLLLLAGLIILTLRKHRRGWRAEIKSACNSRRPMLIFMFSLFSVPLLFSVEGLIGPSLFVSRYLIPVAIGTAFLTAECLQSICIPPSALSVPFSPRLRKALQWGIPPLLTTIILCWVFVHLPGFILSPKNYTDSLAALLPKDQPVLLENAWIFTEVIGRQHDSGVKFVYPLDWAQSISPSAPRLEVTQFHLMQKWKEFGYFSGSILPLEVVVHQNSRFIIVDPHTEPYPRSLADTPTPHFIGNPLLQRFARTHGYHLTEGSTLNSNGLFLTIWSISHDPEVTGPPVPASTPIKDAQSVM